MRLLRSSLFVSILLSSFPLKAQDPPRRDPQAVMVLQQALAVMSAAPNDSVLTGAVDIIAGSKQEKVRIRILTRGLDQFAEELDTEDGQRASVHSRGRAEVREGFERKKLPLEQVFSTQLPTALNVVIAAALVNPDTRFDGWQVFIRDYGTETILDGLVPNALALYPTRTSAPWHAACRPPVERISGSNGRYEPVGSSGVLSRPAGPFVEN